MKRLFVACTSMRFILHWGYYMLASNKETIDADLNRNLNQFVRRIPLDVYKKPSFLEFCFLMTFYTMFRNIFYARVGNRHHYYAKFLSILALPQPLLDISETAEIGGGLIVQHGYGTIISPAKMGRNCWVNQGVSIGHKSEKGQPLIGDNVRIAAGALVLGPLKIGRGATVAPGAVIMKNVPDYAIAVGNPARITGFTMPPEEIIEYEKSYYIQEERIPLNKLEKNFEKYYINRRNDIANYLNN
ncbi:MAG: serine acetyltransferase [Paraprevotella sp.]|nr:serine acetyltransferase [Paraprevotella sp.]